MTNTINDLKFLLLSIAVIVAVFFVAGVIEAILLRIFPSSYPNVLRDDARIEYIDDEEKGGQ